MIWDALRLSLLAGAGATALGALPIGFAPRPSKIWSARLTGFAGGVMLSASVFSLASPALAMREEAWGSQWWTFGLVALSFFAGALAVDLINRFVPHEHFLKGPEGADAAHIRRVWLFVLAITIHNFPEGMAVGVGSALGGMQANNVAIGIGLQNVPEGLVVAAALWERGYARWTAVGVGVLSGLVEPIGALLGVAVIAVSRVALPGALLFASGAMVFVVASEVFPESHEGGHGRAATWAAIFGFVLNMVLDVALA